MSVDSSSPNYTFTPTQDWFTHNESSWKGLFKLIDSPAPRVLEIGTWEGRSAVFLANNLCAKGGSIVCIDHFDLGRTDAGIERLQKVTSNLAKTGKPHRILEMFSFPALTRLLEEELVLEPGRQGYDWIYIDGSHEADDTFLDGELVWRLAKKGAVIIFDDYHWDAQPEDSIHHPKRGIDAFLQLHAGGYEKLSSPGAYQMVLKKTTDMRIGFLASSVPTIDDNTLGYRLNVAIAANSSYAMGASVVLRSIADTTTGAITVYIVDCGLSESDQNKLRSTVNKDNITIVFLSLPHDSLASELGPMWVQIDMLSEFLLPVERVLYLDADILVRGNLRPLWELDLGEHAIGAVRDVGFPNGTGNSPAGEYFNAGVMLLNLTRIRGEIEGLKKRCREMRNMEFHGQDVLNAHFAGRWRALEMVWNGQGLGTYANIPSPSRDILDLGTMKSNPKIVHFTGPVHPSMAQVLNPYVQPYTAKPWGYAGAPGNPFAAEWRAVLDKTEWASYFASEGFKRVSREKQDEAIADGIEEFKRRAAPKSH